MSQTTRGDRRLLIAGRLMSPPSAEDAADALLRVRAMPAAEAEQLRELVDWVEAYEAAETHRVSAGQPDGVPTA